MAQEKNRSMTPLFRVMETLGICLFYVLPFIKGNRGHRWTYAYFCPMDFFSYMDVRYFLGPESGVRHRVIGEQLKWLIRLSKTGTGSLSFRQVEASAVREPGLRCSQCVGLTGLVSRRRSYPECSGGNFDPKYCCG